jgi:hypothetical protein
MSKLAAAGLSSTVASPPAPASALARGRGWAASCQTVGLGEPRVGHPTARPGAPERRLEGRRRLADQHTAAARRATTRPASVMSTPFAAPGDEHDGRREAAQGGHHGRRLSALRVVT